MVTTPSARLLFLAQDPNGHFKFSGEDLRLGKVVDLLGVADNQSLSSSHPHLWLIKKCGYSGYAAGVGQRCCRHPRTPHFFLEALRVRSVLMTQSPYAAAQQSEQHI